MLKSKHAVGIVDVVSWQVVFFIVAAGNLAQQRKSAIPGKESNSFQHRALAAIVLPYDKI
ncbi:hypothetical protein BHQ31_09905 [Burkholderia cenocepacia]|nr:hypothetical protein BHQ31_09905 [Burkholderia cenocepacia]